MENVFSLFETTFGIGVKEFSTWHIIARCILIYLIGIALVRIGNKRFIGKMSAFDIIIAIIIGSLLSRAISHESLFLELILASVLLILLHKLFSFWAASSDWFGDWIKGQERVLVKEGEINWETMRKSNLSEQDLMQTLRLNARSKDIKNVTEARLERNGDISFILKSEDK